MANNSPFMTTRQRFLEKVETLIKDINNQCFPVSDRIQDLQVLCDQVGSYLVVLIEDRIYCANKLLIALSNFDINCDSEDYCSIWDYLKFCELPK